MHTAGGYGTRIPPPGVGVACGHHATRRAWPAKSTSAENRVAARECRLPKRPQNTDVDSPESYRPSQSRTVDFLSTTERLYTFISGICADLC